MKTNIGVFFGGRSTEHEIPRRVTGTQVTLFSMSPIIAMYPLC